MITYIEMAHTGVRGVVRKGGKPVAANITVDGIAHTMYSDPAQGDFYRPLTEGTCTLWFLYFAALLLLSLTQYCRRVACTGGRARADTHGLRSAHGAVRLHRGQFRLQR